MMPEIGRTGNLKLRTHLRPRSPWARLSGRRLKLRRQTVGCSLNDLADAAGTTKQTIVTAEAGALIPRPHMQTAIAYVLGVTPAAIWTPLTNDEIAAVLVPYQHLSKADQATRLGTPVPS